MKITKFLPLALALTLAVPAFAAEGDGTSAFSDLQISVPSFINITRNEDLMVESADATLSFTETNTSLSLNKNLVASFHVLTNNPNEQVKLTATALAGGSQTNALSGNDEEHLNIVFTNIGSGARAATGDAVKNILDGADAAKNNANAIAFMLTPLVETDNSTNAAITDVKKVGDGVEYKITNGEYDFKYTVGTTSLANTFSTHDTDGTYQATITLSRLTSN